jgi:phage terminase large subunit
MKTAVSNTEVQIARWFQYLCETSNKTFIPLFFDEHRFLVLKGGGGSGKSVFAARKLIERAFAEPGHRFLVCRKVAKTLRESCWRNILDQMGEYYPGRYKANKSDMTITCDNGTVFLFAGLDDVEKLKSIVGITGIWIEEASEVTEEDFNQLNIRLRDESQYYQQIILSFNPISIMHWLKLRFFDRKDPEARTHESTYKDNRFLKDEAKKVLEDFKNTDRYFYEVYCLGMWGTTGRTVFDGEAVTKRLLDNVKPVRVGMMAYDYDGLSITNVRFVDDPQGYIYVFEEPQVGVPYVLGGDTAGEGSDQFVDQVVNNCTGKQAAILRQGFDEDLYAHQTYALGIWYNTALIGIETNFSTYPVKELQRLRYPRQYVRERVDTYTGQIVQAYGFETTTKTRPLIIAGLIKAMRDDITQVCDKFTLQEMLTFVRSESWKPEAEEGAHDDCIMALAIAHYIRPQQDYLTKAEEEKRAWTDAMWEDYRNASPKEREEMLRDWGQPIRR